LRAQLPALIECRAIIVAVAQIDSGSRNRRVARRTCFMRRIAEESGLRRDRVAPINAMRSGSTTP
jgi:hypothetical protein